MLDNVKLYFDINQIQTNIYIYKRNFENCNFHLHSNLIGVQIYSDIFHIKKKL